MERLFFSAPPHDERTCTACHRKKSASPGTPSWLRAAAEKEKRATLPARIESIADDGDKPPPQTVLTKVVRELEDDFTHYKS